MEKEKTGEEINKEIYSEIPFPKRFIGLLPAPPRIHLNAFGINDIRVSIYNYYTGTTNIEYPIEIESTKKKSFYFLRYTWLQIKNVFAESTKEDHDKLFDIKYTIKNSPLSNLLNKEIKALQVYMNKADTFGINTSIKILGYYQGDYLYIDSITLDSNNNTTVYTCDHMFTKHIASKLGAKLLSNIISVNKPFFKRNFRNKSELNSAVNKVFSNPKYSKLKYIVIEDAVSKENIFIKNPNI